MSFRLKVTKKGKVVANRYFSSRAKAEAYWDRATEYGFLTSAVGLRKSIVKVKKQR